MKRRNTLVWLGFSSLLPVLGFGQIDQKFVFEKERDVVIPPASRVFDKVPLTKGNQEAFKLNYSFFERKPTGLETVAFQPSIISPLTTDKTPKKEVSYANQVRLGAGNFGRTFGEVFINSPQSEKLVFGFYGLHNAAKRGPIQDVNSGNSKNVVRLDGQYNAGKFKLSSQIGYERRLANFYGYDTTFVNLERGEIKQAVNTFQFGVGFQNANPSSLIDYQVRSTIFQTSDLLSAEELDWASDVSFSYPILTDKLVAKVDAEVYRTQRSDNYIDFPVRDRNLFRIIPRFIYNHQQFAVTAGVRAVNEFDEIARISRTKGFPTLDVTYKTPSLLYFSVGYDGDIIRNTLGSMLRENPFLMPQVNLLNTDKLREIYLASKGEVTDGLNYQVRASYGQYQNLYFFMTNDLSNEGAVLLRNFDIQYENERTNFAQIDVQLNYQPISLWRTNLKAQYNYYEVKSLEKPFHRPSVEVYWGNTLTVSDKLIANLNIFHLGGIYAKDPFSLNEPIKKLTPIFDINTELTYLLNQQFGVFIKMNNLLGNNYQRYLYYPQQGLNFLVGVNISL
ncbi:MAG: hypothetical protein ACK4R6_01955 [Spirosomataceae bacterium]